MSHTFIQIFTFFSLALLFSPSHALHDYPADRFWATSDDSSVLQVDHSAWQSVLDDFLIKDHGSGVNRFDYQKLKSSESKQLDSYLAEMSAIEIQKYSRAEQFAYWVNLYNAITVSLVVDNYPVSSIKKIYGGWFNSGPWDETVFALQGKKLSLNDIEHRILRPVWQDYRIHFAVNCASIGCPNLSATAMTAGNQQELLNSAAKDFLQHPRGFTVTKKGLKLSKIFKWYASDFGADASSILTTLSPHLSEAQRQSIKPNSKLSYQYDWALNDL